MFSFSLRTLETFRASGAVVSTLVPNPSGRFRLFPQLLRGEFENKILPLTQIRESYVAESVFVVTENHFSGPDHRPPLPFRG
jgi:hypothetical protein